MTQPALWMNLVPVAASDPFPLEVAPRFEITDDAADRALGDPDAFSKFAEPDPGLASDENDDMTMVAEESPGAADRRHERPRYVKVLQDTVTDLEIGTAVPVLVFL